MTLSTARALAKQCDASLIQQKWCKKERERDRGVGVHGACDKVQGGVPRALRSDEDVVRSKMDSTELPAEVLSEGGVA
jgi:hypothetical protein